MAAISLYLGAKIEVFIFVICILLGNIGYTYYIFNKNKLILLLSFISLIPLNLIYLIISFNETISYCGIVNILLLFCNVLSFYPILLLFINSDRYKKINIKSIKYNKLNFLECGLILITNVNLLFSSFMVFNHFPIINMEIIDIKDKIIILLLMCIFFGSTSGIIAILRKRNKRIIVILIINIIIHIFIEYICFNNIIYSYPIYDVIFRFGM